MKGAWTKASVMLLTAVFIAPSHTHALEPATALDDCFTAPSEERIVESMVLFPGAESFGRGVYTLCAMRVPFGIEELAVTTALAGVSGNRLGMSMSFSSVGFDLYGEEMGKLGLTYSPVRRVGAGIRLTRNSMRIKGYGDASTWSADAGIVLRPVESVFLAASVEDVTDARLGESEETLDGAARFAAAWMATTRMEFITAVNSVRRFDPSVSAGFTFRILDILTLGAAGGTGPDRFEFLVTVAKSGLRVSVRGSYHAELGMSHGFSLCWGGGARPHKNGLL